MAMNWTKRIDRDELLKAIGQPRKMPRDFQGTFTGINLAGRGWAYGPLTGLTIRVIPTPPSARKSSAHRTFVVCERCGCEVPTGRYHQHYGTGACIPK